MSLDHVFWGDLADKLFEVPHLQNYTGRDTWLHICIPKNLADDFPRIRDSDINDITAIILHASRLKPLQGTWYINQLVEKAVIYADGLYVQLELKQKLNTIKQEFPEINLPLKDFPKDFGHLLQSNSMYKDLLTPQVTLRKLEEHIFNEPEPKEHVITVSGPIKSGKSKLLKTFCERFADCCVPLLLNLQKVKMGSVELFEFNLAICLFDAYQRWFFIRKHQYTPSLPILNWDIWIKDSNTLRNFWVTLVREIQGNTRGPMIILFDEIESLIDISSANKSNDVLSSFIDFIKISNAWLQQAEITSIIPFFIMAGSDTMDNTGNLVFNQFINDDVHRISLPSIENASTHQFWRFVEKLAAIPTKSLERLFLLCDGQIWILESMFDNICLVAGEDGLQPLDSSLNMAIQMYLSDNSDRLKAFWVRLADNERKVLQLLAWVWKVDLEQLSIPRDGVFALADFQTQPGYPSIERDIQDGLTRLKTREWIYLKKKDTEVYGVKIGMMVLWAYCHRYEFESG